MDEEFLTHVFSQHGFTINAYKWIKNHLTGCVLVEMHVAWHNYFYYFISTMAQYCFLEFEELTTARNVLDRLNNQIIPGTNEVGDCNWLHVCLNRCTVRVCANKFQVVVIIRLLVWVCVCVCVCM